MIHALCIDDEVNKEKFRSKADLLLEEGIKVTAIDNVDDALKAIAEQPFDIILLDIAMPIGSLGTKHTNGGISTGLALLRKIREKGYLIPVIVITVRERADIEPYKAELQIADILIKPSESLAGLTAIAIRNALGR